jgi:hypothetical protein
MGGGGSCTRWLAGLMCAATIAGTALVSGPVAASRGPLPQSLETDRRVAVFADSVGLGAATAIPAAFPDGWSVHVDGEPARFVEQMESQYVIPRLASNPEWFGAHVVIAAGYNAPYWDWDRFDRSIDSMVATLTEAGVEHIHWVTLREVTYANTPPGGRQQIELYGFYFPIVNERLRAALDRHPNLSLVDWAAVGSQLGLTYDAIHLNTAGAALYAETIRESVFAAATRVPDQSVTRIGVPGATGAGAAFVNFTTTDPRHAGYLAPAGDGCELANVSVHNYARAQTVAHSAIVPLAGDGAFCVRARSATNLVADTTGVFPTGGGFVALAPARWADTRAGGARLTAGSELRLALAGISLPPDVPAGDVAALALSVTAVDAAGPGWLRVLPCGAASDTSNVNYVDAAATPNLVIVAPNSTGEVCITTKADTHVVVDSFGLFTTSAGIVPVDTRVFDSRTSGGRLPAGAVTTVDASELSAATDADPVRGVVVNLTAVNAAAPGYVTAFPCAAGRPTASNLNVAGPTAVANAAIVAPDADGLICVFNLMETDLVVDIQATVGAAFRGGTPQRLLDTRNAG